MGCRPARSCCCCVPLCCGLRGGVLAIAVVQTVVGILNASYFTSSLVSLVSLAAAGQLTAAGQWFATAGFYLVASVVVLWTGLTGIRASSNVHAVLVLDPAVIRSAHRYWRMNLGLFIYVVVSGLITATLVSWEFSAIEPLTREEAIFAIVLYWAILVAGLLVEAYLLWVVWSYHETLVEAVEGRLNGPFVVKGVPPGGIGPTFSNTPKSCPSTPEKREVV